MLPAIVVLSILVLEQSKKTGKTDFYLMRLCPAFGLGGVGCIKLRNKAIYLHLTFQRYATKLPPVRRLS